VDLVGLKPVLRTTTSFSAFTLLVRSFDLKKTVPEMTYNVFSGTLNPAQSKLSAHANPQPKRHLNLFSRLCTDDRGVSLLFTMVCLFPLKITPSHVGIWTSCNTWGNENWKLTYF